MFQGKQVNRFLQEKHRDLAGNAGITITRKSPGK